MPDTRTRPIIIVGCGYIGQKLVKQLLLTHSATAEHITAVVRSQASQSACEALGIRSLVLDLDDPGSQFPDTLTDSHSILYYFAPPPSQGEQDQRARHFIQLLSDNHSTPPAKIVLISTTGVYGDCHGQWVDESSPVNPQVDRARRRANAEQQFQSYCQEQAIPLVILRVSGIYGSDKLPLKRIKAQTPIVRQEDSPYSNRIHADDLTDICRQAGLDDSIEGIFNCADGHPTTMYDYFMRVAKAHHLPEPPAITLEQAQSQLSAGMLSYMAESRQIDNHKLLEQFQISLKYPDLDSGLKALE
jgi:nucleoside-diphosphate-sugar epimerase